MLDFLPSSCYTCRSTTTTPSRHIESYHRYIISHDVLCPRRCAAHGADRRRKEDRGVLLRFRRGQLRLCCRPSYETAQDSNGPQSDHELWVVQEDGNLCKSEHMVSSAHSFYSFCLPVRDDGALRLRGFTTTSAGAISAASGLLTYSTAR